jgi:cephalosporin-C deacetylase-like acetyl esterase
MVMTRFILWLAVMLGVIVAPRLAPAHALDLVQELRELDARVAPTDQGQLSRQLANDVRRRLREAGERENRAWAAVHTRADWEGFRDARLKSLRDSLGPSPRVPADLKLRVTRRLEGKGYTIENLVFQSRPGLLVTANLYLPSPLPTAGRMPGILLSHSHHAPKTEGELQDMGVNWARRGCAVLVPDHLGHGERRQHPFTGARSYAGAFKPGRQDYYFRYNSSLQLHLAGQSLMGWMVWDLMRGVDVLLSRPGVDGDRIILIGAVAGGGDPAGVTAALDPRIAAVVPFNFGGPQPDYAIPENAERDFEYFGWPWWESTRCLRRSARDGFAHWMIVASAAPRRLVYAHEFSWDPKRDPVWPRIGRVFDLYDVPDRLAVATGRGSLKGQSPQASHCNNVGPLHRAALYPAFEKWFNMPSPADASDQRHKAEDLSCLSPQVIEEFSARLVFELAAELGARGAAAARERLAGLDPVDRRHRLRQDWSRLLGKVEPSDPKVAQRREGHRDKVSIEHIALEVEPGVHVTLVMLVPRNDPETRFPTVVAFAQEGKQQLLRQRAQAFANLLAGGVAVCLADLRGTGESTPADRNRGRGGEGTSLSQAELMLGQTLLGARLRDLRSVLRYLRTRPDVDRARLALWGDSLAPVNPPDRMLEVPLDADNFPGHAEPLGGLLALLGMLFEEDLSAAYGHGGLAGFQSCLRSPFCYVPHDAIVPGALMAGDLGDVAAAISPRPLFLAGLVDGLNRRASARTAAEAFDPALGTYRAAGAADGFVIDAEKDDDGGAEAAAWLAGRLVR